jgi:putative endonuclease
MDRGENQRIGKIGEGLAADYLRKKGYEIIKKNYRAKQYGEVDLIAVSPNKKTLVFVEVKTRIGDEFGRPEEAVGKGKLRELKKMVDYYYQQFPKTTLDPQIDVVAIILNPDESVASLEHLENVTL